MVISLLVLCFRCCCCRCRHCSTNNKSLNLRRWTFLPPCKDRRKCKSIETVEFQHPCRHLCTVSYESILRAEEQRRRKKHSLTRVLFVFLDIFFLISFWPRVFFLCALYPRTHTQQTLLVSPLANKGKKLERMYSSYLKISFSFIVANPTILHRYKCLCSVSGVRARIYAFYLLYLSFFILCSNHRHHLFSESKKNVIHHSMMEYICLRIKK